MKMESFRQTKANKAQTNEQMDGRRLAFLELLTEPKNIFRDFNVSSGWKKKSFILVTAVSKMAPEILANVFRI